MNLLKILKSLIEEHNFSAALSKNHITFRKNPPKGTRYGKGRLLGRKGPPLDNYRLEIKNNDVSIFRMIVKTAGMSGRPYFIPEKRKLLSVDIHDPRSLNAIRDWLKAL